MKITIERKYKKEGYTIGNLFINGKWICNTLELKDRGLHQNMDRIKLMKAKLYGYTAIPVGCYMVRMQMSEKFKARRPYLLDVPGFMGIMIHEGNKPSDTLGCILVGMNTRRGRVLQSRETLGLITEMILKAEERCEPVVISVR